MVAANQREVRHPTYAPGGSYPEHLSDCPECQSPYEWQFLPEGLLYKSYLAGPKETRLATAWLYDRDHGWVWDSTLGGRVGIFRYGTEGAVQPQGWQLDIEGAAMTRLDVENMSDLMSVDFRFGIPLTWTRGPYEFRFGYDHVSSHLGDEFLLSNPGFPRVNYVRDALLFGAAYHLNQDNRIYGEAGWAFNTSVADPWQLQFGYEYSPRCTNCTTRFHRSPFFAMNVQLFEEHDFGGNFNLIAGWQWRARESDRLLRLGLQYFNGKSSQYSFFDQHQELIGAGIWLDY
jgi:hypothetical protein